MFNIIDISPPERPQYGPDPKLIIRNRCSGHIVITPTRMTFFTSGANKLSLNNGEWKSYIDESIDFGSANISTSGDFDKYVGDCVIDDVIPQGYNISYGIDNGNIIINWHIFTLIKGSLKIPFYFFKDSTILPDNIKNDIQKYLDVFDNILVTYDNYLTDNSIELLLTLPILNIPKTIKDQIICYQICPTRFQKRELDKSFRSWLKNNDGIHGVVSIVRGVNLLVCEQIFNMLLL